MNYRLTDAPGLDECGWNCSGHGVCQQGKCQCLVQYSGLKCDEANPMYYVVFGSIFSCVGFVAVLQLLLCVVCEHRRNKDKSWRIACEVTVQKLLYTLVICASSLRGAYFFSKWRASEYIASFLWCSYFPFLITGCSLLICSWAEDVHVNRKETPRFLSKSVLAFVLFNVCLYLVVCTVLLVTDIVPDTEDLSLKAYNGAVAIIFIILVILFLIYGVELYFRMEAPFAKLHQGVEVDRLQVAMSRLGLVSQALLQLLMGLFLVADVITDHWKNTDYRLTVIGQNYYELVFRVVEFGVLLWFPCVLWNYRQPEELWVLNPRRILRSLKSLNSTGCDLRTPLCRDSRTSADYNTYSQHPENVNVGHNDCWICYDAERTDAGPLLQPCECRGDVATVHHNCLQRWLIESSELGKTPKCKVCKQKYKLERVTLWSPKSVSSRSVLTLIVLLMLMVGSPILSYYVCHTGIVIYVKVLLVGCTVVFELFLLKVFIVTTTTIWGRMQIASMKIIGKEMKNKANANINKSNMENSCQHAIGDMWQETHTNPREATPNSREATPNKSKTTSCQLHPATNKRSVSFVDTLVEVHRTNIGD